MHHNPRIPFGVIILMPRVIKRFYFYPGEFLPAKSQLNKSIETIAFTSITTTTIDWYKASKYFLE